MTVYFVEARETEAIKIGYTSQLDRRVAALNTSTPGGCFLVCSVPGGLEVEQYFHALLAEHSMGNEWFRPTEQVGRVVVEVCLHGESVVPVELRGDQTVDSPKDISALVTRMARFIRLCASPAVEGEPVPDAIRRASQNTGLSIGRCTSYWYEKVREVPAEEWLLVRRIALAHADDPYFLRHELKRVHAELAAIGASIERLGPALRDMAGGPFGSRNNGGAE